jgi:hypothetical protein
MTDVPPDRARWRLTVHRRDFGPVAYSTQTGITELSDATSRRLELALNTPAKLTFTIDGRSPGAVYVTELTTEIMAWRWDPDLGADRLMFRGIVAQSEDVLSENGAHSVNFTCHDWLAVMNRRYLTNPTDWTQNGRDQDDWVADLLARASAVTGSGGTPYTPGSHLPLVLELVNPDGTPRSSRSGRLRDRTYAGQQSIGSAITDLGACLDGFDLDVAPAADSRGYDLLRVFYPTQGTARSDVVLAYGSSVSALTRSANSVNYGNYWRVIGDNGQASGDRAGWTSDAVASSGNPQLWAEAANADANDVGRIPVGLWMAVANESDVSVAATLQEKTDGDLSDSGILVPSYSLTLRPGWYRPGHPAMGDTLGLIVRSGRLDVSSTVRVQALRFVIGDDGQEDVEIDVGRPRITLSALFRETKRDVDALARR